MARETQSSPASEKKLEQYGVWVKVKPREVVPAPALEESFELSDLEPPRGAAAPQRPETDESSLTAEEEKLLDELETELGPEEGSADVLVPDEEPLLEEEGELPDMDSLTREAEVTLSEGTPADDHFDDLEALESELASVASSARPAAATSSEILARIEEELRSIRVDLTQLRGELSGLRTRANQPAAETPASGAETQSGFFDEDEDETIALTGDELDNILNTADITEEAAETPNVDPGVARQGPSKKTKAAEPLEDILSYDTPLLEEDAIAPVELVEDALVILDDTLLPLEGLESADSGTATLEELPSELVLEELALPADASPARGAGAGLEELPELDLEGIPEIETETASSDAGDETIDLETLDIGEEPTVIEAAPAETDAIDSVAGEVDLEALAEEAKELEDEAPAASMDDLEIGELESLEDGPVSAAAPQKEIEIPFETGPDSTAESGLELLALDDEEPADQILDAEEVPEQPASDSRIPAPNGAAIPDNLKDEIRTVLKYMDHLLEALPDEKIQEFAGSDYFVMYKKLFEDLGLGE